MTFDRDSLYEEFHQRRPIPIAPRDRVTHISLHVSGIPEAETSADLARLCRRLDVAPPAPNERGFFMQNRDFRLKWERHTEFVSYTLCRRQQAEDSHIEDCPVLSVLRKEAHGTLLSAAHIEIEPAERNAIVDRPGTGDGKSFPTTGGVVCDGHASVWSDFTLDENGFSRIVVKDAGLGPHRCGRLVQRLLDIETYRIAALLGLRTAHRTNEKVSSLESELTALLGADVGEDEAVDDQALLRGLLSLSAETEHLLSTASFRFDATNAYAKLVFKRLQDLNEQRIQGAQRFTNFLERRFIPAVETCDTAANRLRELASHIHRDAALIRTRVDVARQEQNNLLLESMNRRSHTQLQLQQTVEAISTVAISYYGIGIFSVFAKSLSEVYGRISPPVLTGLAAPVIIGLVFLVTRQARRRLLDA